MANTYFVVQNGLQVGPLTIDATTGSITTSGDVSITGNLGVSQISKNDSSVSINDTGSGSTVVIKIDGATEQTIDANGVNLASGGYFSINGSSVLNATTLGSGVTASSLTSVGTLNGLTVNSTGLRVNGTITAATLNAGTIGNTGATLTGTLSTAAQTNITSVGTLTGLTVSGTTSLQGTTAGTLNVTSGNITTLAVTTGLSTGNAVITGGSVNNTTIGATTPNTGRFSTVIATSVSAGTIGNTGATLTGTLSTAAQTNITSVGTLTGLTVSGTTNLQGTTAGTLNATSGNITTLAVTTGLSTGNARITGGYADGFVIGANTAASGRFTTLNTTGAATIGGILNVTGNLNVAGNVSYFNSNDLVISDSLIYLADNNTGDVLDIGLISSFTNPGYQHTGLVRDASDGTWKLFADVVAEPTTTVDFTNATYSPLRIGALTATSGTYSGAIIASTVSAGTIGNSGATLTGTLSTAAQTNITSVGTLTGLTVSGNTAINSTLYGRGVYDNGVRVVSTSSGAGNLTISGTEIDLTATGPGAVSVGSSTAIPVITADAYGRIASWTTAAVVAPAGTLSGSTLASGVTASSLTSVGTITTGVWQGTSISTTYTAAKVTDVQAGTGVSVTATTGSVGVSIGQAVATSSSPTFAGITLPSITKSGTNGTGDIGSSSNYFGTVYGKATTAQYADLAENYRGDKFYNPGTVVMFGGAQEVTLADPDTNAVAGVVSTNPAHLMNGQLSGPNVVPLALTGRVPCMVIGPVKKGDMMVSAGFGYAKSSTNPSIGQVIGKALEDFPMETKGVIEVVVGRL